MTTIMFRRGDVCRVAEIFQTIIEPLDEYNRQVVFFCKDKSGRKYHVYKSEVLMTGVVESKPKEKKKKRKCA